jgi:hypothetical protein
MKRRNLRKSAMHANSLVCQYPIVSFINGTGSHFAHNFIFVLFAKCIAHGFDWHKRLSETPFGQPFWETTDK